jgi:hypothetical protein
MEIQFNFISWRLLHISDLLRELGGENLNFILPGRGWGDHSKKFGP